MRLVILRRFLVRSGRSPRLQRLGHRTREAAAGFEPGDNLPDGVVACFAHSHTAHLESRPQRTFGVLKDVGRSQVSLCRQGDRAQSRGQRH